MVFVARQLQEKCQEQNTDLYSTYVDLTKTFDSVSRDGLWRIMTKYSCPEKFITIVRQFHDGMQARVQDNGESSEAFPVINGVKQRCVLAPALFSIMFSAMLFDAFNGSENGINIRNRTESCVQSLKASSKDQREDWYHQRVAVRRRLCTEIYYQIQHAKQCWQILQDLW